MSIFLNTTKEVSLKAIIMSYPCKFVGMNLKIMLVDLGKRDVCLRCNVRAEQGWTVKMLKTFIAEVL